MGGREPLFGHLSAPNLSFEGRVGNRYPDSARGRRRCPARCVVRAAGSRPNQYLNSSRDSRIARPARRVRGDTGVS